MTAACGHKRQFEHHTDTHLLAVVAHPMPFARSTVYDPANAITFTVCRLRSSGSPYDRDIFGAQPHAPLLDIEVPA